MKTVEELTAQLSPDLQQEVRDIAQFQFEKLDRPKREKLRLKRVEGIRGFRDQLRQNHKTKIILDGILE